MLPRNLPPAELVRECRTTMKDHAKSFSLAALAFNRQTKESVELLYSWCRFCDDHIDQASPEVDLEARCQQLEEWTDLSLKGMPPPIAPFQALAWLVSEYDIPSPYVFELLKGIEMDSGPEVVLETTEELELYCYRVAGVVGLIMSHIMGVSSERALPHAIHLGLAMQKTNISRDIVEDFERGRIYLPRQWFLDLNLPFPPTDRKDLTNSASKLTFRLLSKADQYYESARMGLTYLPLRSALAVGIAVEVYRGIGLQVLKRKDQAWNSRSYVATLGKIQLAIKGVFTVLLNRSWLKIHRPVPIQKIWRTPYV